jgi:predicted O-methyltransferase YrrM
MADDNSRAGLGYSTPAIKTYLENLFSPHSAALEDAVHQLDVMGMPRIQIAPTEGKILQVLLSMIGARKVVEFGTLSGYSALWILKALGMEGHLWTCEYSPKHAKVAQGVFERAGLSAQVTLLEGPALNALDKLATEAPFDAVFIDADKKNYIHYARWAFEHLRPGGLIIGDNTYLFGYLKGRAPDEHWNQEAIEGMTQFHEFLAEHCLAVCLPTADGLSVGVKV